MPSGAAELSAAQQEDLLVTSHISVSIDADGAILIRVARPDRDERIQAIQREIQDLGLAEFTEAETEVLREEPIRRIGF